jgi:hypothetical protein
MTRYAGAGHRLKSGLAAPVRSLSTNTGGFSANFFLNHHPPSF